MRRFLKFGDKSSTKVDSVKPRPMMTTSLHSQTVVPAAIAVKIRVALIATAMVDALGGPAEFQQRFSFPLVDSMLFNSHFRIPAGSFTDDTSMALCLARSLAKGTFDPHDQMRNYVAWMKDGYLSSVGYCFDVGMTIGATLRLYDRIKDKDSALAKIQEQYSSVDTCSGNGSLMRVLPVGLAYWKDEKEAKEYAGRSSVVTHPSVLCVEACEVWTGAIVRVMQAAHRQERFSKLDLVRYFATYDYGTDELREALTVPSSAPSIPQKDDVKELEEYFYTHHPILKVIEKSCSFQPSSRNPLCLPDIDTLPSTGYVLHSIVAALYSFLATDSFEEGAIVAVNLGEDADTVGAIYAGLAGCWYGQDDDAFWTRRVKKWKEKMASLNLVEEVAVELLEAYSDGPDLHGSGV